MHLRRVLFAITAIGWFMAIASGTELDLSEGNSPAAGPGPAATATAGATGAAASGEFGQCRTCVFVLERIKKGTNMLLPAICSDIYTKFPDAYSYCHQVLNSLALNGNNVRYWLFEGCYKFEVYNSKEWIKPCPSHVMCSILKDLRDVPFCPAMPMEDPFSLPLPVPGGASGAAAGGTGAASAPAAAAAPPAGGH